MTRRPCSAAAAVCVMMGGLVAAFGADSGTPKPAPSGIQREVRHELLMLSRYSVFDNIEYKVDGTKVTLLGQVVTPVLKDDAGNAVKGIGDVTNVDNKIEILPPSSMDAGIRLAVYKAIYGDPGLSRYAVQAVPSIHIIVNNGSITLTGAVGTEMDKNVAGIRANSVPGTFAVTNNLQVDSNL